MKYTTVLLLMPFSKLGEFLFCGKTRETVVQLEHEFLDQYFSWPIETHRWEVELTDELF